MGDALALGDIAAANDDEPRVRDVRVAERLGMAQPLNIRQTIERNRTELEGYGLVHTSCEPTRSGKGRISEAKVYWLNEGQTLVICMLSRTPQAAQVRKEVIEVFMAYRRNQLIQRTLGALPDMRDKWGLVRWGDQFLLVDTTAVGAHGDKVLAADHEGVVSLEERAAGGSQPPWMGARFQRVRFDETRPAPRLGQRPDYMNAQILARVVESYPVPQAAEPMMAPELPAGCLPIDRGVPMPDPLPSQLRKFPFAMLQVGESFFAPGRTAKSIGGALWSAAQHTGFRFTSRTENGGVRVWRIE